MKKPPAIDPDQGLLTGLQAGQEAAWRTLIQRHQASLIAFARRLVGPAIADEVVQESWVAVMKHVSRFEGRSSLKTWLFTIVGNEARSRLRREAREPPC